MSYNWNSTEKFPDEALNKLAQDWTAFGEETISRKPRPILREFIHILDLCEENPNISYKELVNLEKIENNIVTEITDLLQQY
jgi:hypothetical protein